MDILHDGQVKSLCAIQKWVHNLKMCYVCFASRSKDNAIELFEIAEDLITTICGPHVIVNGLFNYDGHIHIKSQPVVPRLVSSSSYSKSIRTPKNIF